MALWESSLGIVNIQPSGKGRHQRMSERLWIAAKRPILCDMPPASAHKGTRPRCEWAGLTGLVMTTVDWLFGRRKLLPEFQLEAVGAVGGHIER